MKENGIEFERKPKKTDYGIVAVIKDFHGKIWYLVRFKEIHPMSRRVQ